MKVGKDFTTEDTEEFEISNLKFEILNLKALFPLW